MSINEKLCTRRNWWIPLILFVCALAWRLPYTLSVQYAYGDEVMSNYRTVNHILGGGVPVYLYANSYMAPLQEWAAAALVSIWGESRATLRLPCVLLGCLSIILFYRNLLVVTKPIVAFALCVPLVCTNSFTGIYTAFGIPSYASACVFAALLQSATFALDRRRSPGLWLAFGILAGVSLYVFKILALQVGASLIWLLIRSRAWDETVALIQSDARIRRRTFWALALAGVGMAAAAAFAYRYLTRPESFQPSALDRVASLVAVGAFAIAAFLGARVWRGRAVEWGCIGGFVVLILAITLPPELYFTRYEKPRLIAAKEDVWEGSRYMLRHIHEWPFQARLFLERAFASFLIGRVDELPIGGIESVKCGWRTVLSVGFFAALIGCAVRRWMGGERPDWKAPHWIFIVPFFLIIALMLPSWQLHSDWSARYFIPFQIGFHLVVYWVCAPTIHRYPRLSLGAVVAYALYCGFDTFFHTQR